MSNQKQYFRRVGNIECKGQAVKKTKAHWFVVQNGVLFYSKDENTENEILSTMILDKTVEIKDQKDKKKGESLIINSATKKFRELVLYFPTTEEKDAWKNSLKENIFYGSKTVFGCPLSMATLKSTTDVPQLFTSVVDYFKKNPEHLETEGIFRVSASQDAVQDLKREYDEGHNPDLTKVDSPHIVTNALKLFLRELPDPLLTFDLYDDFLKVAKSGCKREEIAAIIKNLPDTNLKCLYLLLQLLQKAALQYSKSKMGEQALAVVFGPTILRSQNENFDTAARDSGPINTLVEEMIRFGPSLIGNNINLNNSISSHNSSNSNININPKPPSHSPSSSGGESALPPPVEEPIPHGGNVGQHNLSLKSKPARIMLPQGGLKNLKLKSPLKIPLKPQGGMSLPPQRLKKSSSVISTHLPPNMSVGSQKSSSLQHPQISAPLPEPLPEAIKDTSTTTDTTSIPIENEIPVYVSKKKKASQSSPSILDSSQGDSPIPSPHKEQKDKRNSKESLSPHSSLSDSLPPPPPLKEESLEDRITKLENLQKENFDLVSRLMKHLQKN